MRTYNKNEFDKLLYPVNKAPKEGKLLAIFPNLENYSEFTVKLPFLSPLTIFKYIVYTYDQKSPLMVIESLRDRKMEAALLAGFSRDEKGFKSIYIEVMACRNKIVNKMIVRYCRMQYPMKFSHLMATTEAYFSIMEELIRKDTVADPAERIKMEKDRVDLSTKSSKMFEQIDDLTRELLAKDESWQLGKDLFQEIEEENKNSYITPELRTIEEEF